MFSLCGTCREHAYLLLPQKWAHAHKSTSKLGVQKIKRGLSLLKMKYTEASNTISIVWEKNASKGSSSNEATVGATVFWK